MHGGVGPLANITGPGGARIPRAVIDWAFANKLCFYCFEPGHDRLHCPNFPRRDDAGGAGGAAGGVVA